MFTFLRKIRRSFLDSGATRKYLLYSIGEIALVVIGILIALQINNWSEYRKNRKVETKILEEVVKNLEVNILRLQTNIDQNAFDNHSTDITLSVIDNKLPYTDSLDKHFTYALNPVDIGSFINFTGYESLKNTGFSIIMNSQLQQEIISLFEGTYLELEGRYARLEESRKAIGIFNREHFYRKSAAYEFTPINFENLMRNKQFYSWLNNLKGNRGWISMALLESKNETERVLQLIRDELGEANGN